MARGHEAGRRAAGSRKSRGQRTKSVSLTCCEPPSAGRGKKDSERKRLVAAAANREDAPGVCILLEIRRPGKGEGLRRPGMKKGAPVVVGRRKNRKYRGGQNTK